MDVLSHKTLLNLHLPSLEILKDFIHIPVPLQFFCLSPSIHSTPQTWFILQKSWFNVLENFGENVILSSSHAKFSTDVKKMPLQIPHLKPLTNNETDKQH